MKLKYGTILKVSYFSNYLHSRPCYYSTQHIEVESFNFITIHSRLLVSDVHL